MLPSRKESRRTGFIIGAVALAAVLLLAGTAFADEARMRAHLDWIAEHSDYPAGVDPPQVTYESTENMQLMYYGAEAVREREAELFPVEALYRMDLHLMILPEGFVWGDPMTEHFVVHELVHHHQALAGDERCPGLREEEAYHLHQMWMDEHDSPAPRPNAMYVVTLAMSCSVPY